MEDIPPRKLKKLLKKNRFKKLGDLLTELALGQQLADIVAAQLVPETTPEDNQRDAVEALSIAGTEGSAVNFGNCCHPIPGDEILGYLSAGKGIVVHRQRCRNRRELQKHPERCLNVEWAPIINGTFPVSLRVITKNDPGVLASISTSISEAHSNIERVEQPESNPETATLLFTLSVQDRDHMARVMRRVKRNNNVIRVSRITT